MSRKVQWEHDCTHGIVLLESLLLSPYQSDEGLIQKCYKLALIKAI